jgi:hypothetical protein
VRRGLADVEQTLIEEIADHLDDVGTQGLAEVEKYAVLALRHSAAFHPPQLQPLVVLAQVQLHRAPSG